MYCISHNNMNFIFCNGALFTFLRTTINYFNSIVKNLFIFHYYNTCMPYLCVNTVTFIFLHLFEVPTTDYK
jgi:hypothetical protein